MLVKSSVAVNPTLELFLVHAHPSTFQHQMDQKYPSEIQFPYLQCGSFYFFDPESDIVQLKLTKPLEVGW